MKKSSLLFLILLIQAFLASGQGIIINSGAQIEMAGSPYLVINDGGLTINGTYTKATEEIFFTGTSADSLNGPLLDAYNITFSNTGGIKTNVDTLICQNVTINSGSLFTLSAGKFLTVNNSLSNNEGLSGLRLKSDENASASVISTSTGVLATVEKYLKADKWYIVSSPVSGQTISGFLANNDSIPHGPGIRGMTIYAESLGSWGSFFSNSEAGSLDPGEGYLVRTSLDTLIYFEGSLNNIAVNSFPISRNTSGWNSIGNPFSSSIMISESADPVNNFITVNSNEFDSEHVAVYVWDEQSGYLNKNRNDFVALNLLSDTAHLKPGQGFMVKASAGGGSLDFSTAMRDHHNQTAFSKKSGRKSPKSQVKLTISDEENTATTKIYFVQNATAGLDPGYDAGLFGGLKDFKLYTQLAGGGTDTKFMIQALPDIIPARFSIPVGIECDGNSSIRFTAQSIALPEGMEIILEDKQRKIFTDLKPAGSFYKRDFPDGSYGTGNFVLHSYDPRSLDSEVTDYSQLKIYEANKSLIIKGKVEENTFLRIYDLLGHEVQQEILQNDLVNTINVSQLKKSIYIIQIIGRENSYSQKLFIN